MLEIIHHARNLSLERSAWEILGYEPGQKHLQYALSGFETLIKRMTINNINENELMECKLNRRIDMAKYHIYIFLKSESTSELKALMNELLKG